MENRVLSSEKLWLVSPQGSYPQAQKRVEDAVDRQQAQLQEGLHKRQAQRAAGALLHGWGEWVAAPEMKWGV